MTEFKIDKDVPIPPERARTRKYPISELDINDSFEVFEESCDLEALQSRLATNARYYSWRYHDGKRKFVTRQTKTGVRVWRVK